MHDTKKIFLFYTTKAIYYTYRVTDFVWRIMGNNKKIKVSNSKEIKEKHQLLQNKRKKNIVFI
jgi:hypothetical protein